MFSNRTIWLLLLYHTWTQVRFYNKRKDLQMVIHGNSFICIYDKALKYFHIHILHIKMELKCNINNNNNPDKPAFLITILEKNRGISLKLRKWFEWSKYPWTSTMYQIVYQQKEPGLFEIRQCSFTWIHTCNKMAVNLFNIWLHSSFKTDKNLS